MSGFVAAVHAGINPIPVDPSTKRAVVKWGDFQHQRVEVLQAQEWDTAGYAIAWICGDISGRLMCLDFEAGFMEHLDELSRRLADEECYASFKSWVDGYSESTPSGGMHVLVRLEGEGPCPRNDKLAFDAEGKVVVETRGEGGYVIVAPSRNGDAAWTLLRGGVDSIAYCTFEEWSRVEAVLRSFDDTEVAEPPALTVGTRSTVPSPPILWFEGDRWVDEAVAALGDIRTVLSAHGWQPTGVTDSYGEHWTRPGKDPRQGASGSISVNNRLYVHSSNAGMHVGNPTYDVLDVILFYELGRDPVDGERVTYLKAQRPPAERGAGAVLAAEPAAATLNLSTEFWGSREYLAHIHQAALALRLSPDAVWAGVRCFYAACIPWNHRLPGDGTIDYVAIVVGASGAGKSQAKHAAWRLLEDCWQIDGVQFPVPVGSGEGMTEIFVDRDNDDRRYKNRGAGFYADEGKFLLDIGGRSGSTTIQAIKQMWSGELTGSVAATKERHRWLEPRAVRATLLISTTPDIAAQFMRQDLTDEGLPQRICWAWAHYNHPDQAPDWPGPLNVHIWDHNRAPNNLYTIELDPELAQLIDTARLAAAKGQVDGLYEGHATYAMLKSAAIHAHLAGRLTTNMADWALARQEWEITRMVRRHIQTVQHQGAIDRDTAIGVAQADRQIAKDNRMLEKAVLSLHYKLKTEKIALTNRQVKDHLRSFWKKYHIHHLEVINAVIARGWGVRTEDGLHHYE